MTNLLDQLRRHPFIGFEQMFQALDEPKIPNFPPYNVIKKSETQYAINLAVIGRNEDDIKVEFLPGSLAINVAALDDARNADYEVLHNGIAYRGFEKTFDLAKNIVVSHVSLDNGLLTIDLELKLPKEEIPQKIQISSLPKH